MTTELRWTSLAASELIDARDEGRLPEIMPYVPGIYIWRRKVLPPARSRGGATACFEWLKELSSQPSARLTNSALSHCVSVEGIRIGGGGLTGAKERTLRELAVNRKTRNMVLAFVESLSDFLPVIYVGQTDGLQRRVREHLNGETGLRSYVFDMLGLTWTDIEFQYLETAKSSDVSERGEAVRELLEMLAHRLLAPFGVDRPG